MDAGVHLPLIDFGGEGFSYRRLAGTVDAARECAFAAISANDHFVFSAPWLDGPTALAAVAERSGGMKLVTTVALASLRGPVPLAKALSALDILSGGRVIAGVGPGSSRADYEAVGVPFEQRWQRFDEAVRLLKPLLQPGAAADSGTYHATPVAGLSPSPRQRRGIPLWIGSWGSEAGLRRVASLGDGWLASAYNATPEAFTAAMKHLGGELERQGRPPGDFPNALVTMWTWITDKRSDAERVLSQVVGPLVKKDPAEVRGRICVGSAQECAELLSRYARAGCQARPQHSWQFLLRGHAGLPAAGAWPVMAGQPGAGRVPAGPVEVPPREFVPEAEQAAILAGALAGIELGAWDRRILGWLAGWDACTVLTIASWIARSRAAGPGR